MDYLKRLIQNWLGFSRTEINGFLILLPLITILIFFEPVHRWWISTRKISFKHEEKKLDSLIALWNIPRSEDSLIVKPSFFPFNPNSITTENLERLGFPQNLSIRIANYRQKGGKFRIKSDLLKLYGMDSTFYNQLYDYIQLPEYLAQAEKKDIPRVSSFKPKLATVFDINTADTTQLKTVYGIGSKLATRILKFRDGLGGFIKPEQLKEVYGLDSLAIEQLLKHSFIDEQFQPSKINVNKADEKRLASHPYIKRNIAKAIVTYRYQHGEFRQLSDLLNIKIIKPEEEKKLVPYLTVND